MPEILVTGPSAEPVDINLAKLHLRVTDTAQDMNIAMLTQAARAYAEMLTQRQLVHARYAYVIDAFPMAGIGTPLPFRRPVNIPAYAILLPHAPVARVVSITYTDMSGQQQTMPTTDYVTNLAMLPGIITPGFGKVWPISLPQIGAVTITYDAGHASPIKFTGGSANVTVNGPMAWTVGQTVRFSNSGGALPPEFPTYTDIYVKTVAGSTYTFSLTNGGAAIVPAAGDTGTSFVGEIPGGITNGILMRMATLYENREEVAVLNRGKVDPLPFVDGLFDPYRVIWP